MKKKYEVKKWMVVNTFNGGIHTEGFTSMLDADAFIEHITDTCTEEEMPYVRHLASYPEGSDWCFMGDSFEWDTPEGFSWDDYDPRG